MSTHSTPPDLLIVDDDPLIREGLAMSFGSDFKVHQAESREASIALLRDLPNPPKLALIDLGLPPFPHRPEEGFRLIAELLAHAPKIKIFVLSGQNDLSNARHARAMGAIDFIAKPCSPEQIRKHFEDALKIEKTQQTGEFRPLPSEESPGESQFGIIGQSTRIKVLRDQIALYATLPFPVLIEGESGSGKELVATAIQKNGPNRHAPFKILNCAAISPTLIEPTLFGYSKGAFTGATSAQSGFFEDASDGTLFLDEIGELPLELQTKLLRVLENGEYQRVGETTARTSRARIIAATNRNLRDAVRAGSFRSDLYHRLNVFPISVPPLRELGGDKLLLLDHFRAFYSQQIKQAPFQLNTEALQLWERYSFPGNNRELRNIVIRLSTKYPGETVNAKQLQDEFDPFETPATRNRRKQPEDRRQLLQSHGEEPAQRAVSSGYHSSSNGASGSPVFDNTGQVLNQLKAGNFNLDQHLREQEACYISAALELVSGNISEAARLLGINRTTLHSRMGAHEKLKQ
ncbi:MAG: sigma-54-dependent transcriptional regulator [Pseudomonadota bacterium]